MVASTLPASGTDLPNWTRRAYAAALEAQLMSESIAHIAKKLIDDCAIESLPLLEAIMACTMRIDAAIDPLMEQGCPEVGHG